MPIFEKVSGTYKPLAMYEKVGGVWKQIQLYQNVSGVWKLLTASPISVSGVSASGSVTDTNASTLVTSSAAASTVSGGIPPYTYLWTYVSGDVSIACSNANIVNPTFSSTISGVPIHDSITKTAVWNLLVTDGLGSPSGNANGSISLTHNRS